VVCWLTSLESKKGYLRYGSSLDGSSFICLISHAGVAYTGESSLADITLSMFYDKEIQ